MSDVAYFDKLSSVLRAKSGAELDAATLRESAGYSVYRNNVRSGLSRALAEVFPAVYDLVGEDFFKFTANQYFDGNPPKSRLLAEYGDAMPEFLDTFEPARTTPYLGDVARLELAWLKAYRAADTQQLTTDEILSRTTDNDPSALTVGLHPSLTLLRSDYPIAAIWRKCRDNSAETIIKTGNETFTVIVRCDNEVRVDEVAADLFQFLHALMAGCSIGAAIDSSDVNPNAAFEYLFNTKAIISASNTEDE